MNRIMLLIHSVDFVSTIVAWSPNIAIRYFIPSSSFSHRRSGAQDWVGADAPFSTSDRRYPRGGRVRRALIGSRRVYLGTPGQDPVRC